MVDVSQIPIITVSYNAPELLRGLLGSLRQFYRNPIYVIDGSTPDQVEAIRAVAAPFSGVELIVMNYNIHHGPGMAWAIQHLPLKGPALFMDTDVVVRRAGFIEALLAELGPEDYGVGAVAHVNREGFDIPYAYGAVAYLHPPCMLCNLDVMRQWPLPIKHGAPMVAPMLALHDAGQSHLLRNVEWCKNDVTIGTQKIYIDHLGMGTSTRTGGYHLEEWFAALESKKQAAPSSGYNPDLLALIPEQARAIVEVGCSTGALAHAVKALRPQVHYLGLELDPQAAALAQAHCDGVRALDLEAAEDALFLELGDRDCWVFGDVLEHLRDPWRVLTRVRRVLKEGACVVASIPNVQHWSLQGRLAVGDFRYAADGLLDRTHLRWFTRVTIFELFQSAGLRIEAGLPRIFNEPGREPVLQAIRQMALAMGRDPDGAVQDALPLQYVVRAVRATDEVSK